MPVYEYECNACSHRFEEWQKMSDQPVRTCPKCKKKKVERLISQTSFQLKGGGWYSDLYSSKKAATGDKGGGDKGGGGEGGGGEKKPEKTEKKDTKEAAKPATKKDTGGSKTAAV